MDGYGLLRCLGVAVLASLWMRRCEAALPREELGLPPRPAGSREYVLHHWTGADGLPGSTIQCLLQTRDGYLWVGTRDGLVRFDGERFARLCVLNCLSLAEDADGAVWIGSALGLFRGKDGVIQEVVMPEGSPHTDYDHAVFSMCPCPDSGIWLGCGEGLLRANGSGPAKLVDGRGWDFIKGLRLDRGGRLLMATGRGLRAWNLTGTEPPQPLELSPGYDVHCVTEDESGSIWFGELSAVHRLAGALPIGGVLTGETRQLLPVASARGQAAGQPPSGNLTEYRSETAESPDWVNALAQDAQGILWLGTLTGLWQMQSNALVRPLGVDGRGFGCIHCLLVDREGNLFLGTDNRGLFCLERKRFTIYTRTNGLANDDAWSVAVSRDGSVWVGTEGGLSRLVQGQWKNYGTSDGLATERVRSVLEDATGTLWVGTDTAGLGVPGALHRLQHGRFIPFRPADGIASEDFSSICDDGRGSVWIIGGAGLHRWNDGAFQTWTSPDGLHANPRWVFGDRAGNLWLGGVGLDGLRDGKLTRYHPRRWFHTGLYGVLHEDENGALWLGSSDHGLVRFKAGKFKAITSAQGLFSDLVMSLQEDGAGNYWMNSHAGIFRADKQDLNDLADGRRSAIVCVAYGQEDGLLSVEGNGGTLPNSCKTPDGRLWFPTTKGLAVVDPVDTKADALPPAVVLESVQADGETLYHNLPSTQTPQSTAGVGTPEKPKLAEGRKPPSRAEPRTLRLGPGRGHSLRLEFAAPTLIHSDRVRFRYRLAGRDPDWIDIGTQRFVSFQNLPPGRYCFGVTACNRHGVWNETGDQLAFQIDPFFYQTWTFYGLTGAALLLGIAAFEAYRHAVQKRILTLEKDAELAAERERIARDLHDDLGASLSRIALLSEVAQRQLGGNSSATTQISHISDIARRVVDNIGELVWATNPKYDNLESLAAYFRQYAAQCFDGTGIECRLSFPADLPRRALSADFRRQLFMVFQEALGNVAKHAQARRVEVGLVQSPGFLELVIRDNGQGMAPQPVPRLHHGLSNMRERVAALHGTFEIQSVPGQGTRVAIRVPWSHT